jgi:hypothetical protein
MINKTNKKTKGNHPTRVPTFYFSLHFYYVCESSYMNRIAIDFFSLLFYCSLDSFFLFFFFFYESISCYTLKTTRQEERKTRVSERDRQQQDAFRIHSIVKMIVDINSRMLFSFIIFIIISITIAQKQRQPSVTIGNIYISFIYLTRIIFSLEKTFPLLSFRIINSDK